jgi:diaminohydroxyphosphoribosylaminopyrimidine deaminase/5-amino-6-(5-phosphoribosylamino)uracil reductase
MNPHLMQIALNFADKGKGLTFPNPSVASIVEKNGEVLAISRTAQGGSPHSETQALAVAGNAAKGADLYVTLEPCSHFGKNPPCVDAIIKSGVKRVIIALRDPDEKVSGRGIEKLQQAGIEVLEGVLQEEAERIYEDYIKSRTQKLPYVTLKTAISQDGKINYGDKDKQWITSQKSRDYVHILRSSMNSVMTAIGTVEADDPMLNCRLSGLENTPLIRIVLDSNLRISTESKLVKTAKQYPLWVLSCVAGEKKEALDKLGVRVISVQKNSEGKIDLHAALKILANEGIMSILVEAGAKLNSALLKEDLVDKLIIMQAPKTIGEQGDDAFSDMQIADVTKKFTLESSRYFAADLMEVYTMLAY